MARLHSKIVVSSLLSFGALLAAGPARAACPGAVSSSSYRTPLDFNNAGAELTNHLALVTIDTAALIAANKLKADGGDIRFTDGQCNVLDAWVDSGLDTAATKVWVRVPTVPAGASSIFFYYGDPAATRTNDPALLFGSNLVALYTFTEGTGTTVKDHVGGFDLTLSGTVDWTTGYRTGTSAITGFAGGRAMRTDTLPALGAGDFSVLSVAFPKSPSGSTQGIVGTYSNDGTSGWTMKLQGGAGNYMLLTNQAGNWCQQSQGTIAASAWSLIGARREAGLHANVLNGVLAGTSCTGDARDVSAGHLGPWEIGRGYNGKYPFDGNISFTAIYSAARSDADMLALYSSLGLGADVAVAAGAEQGEPGAPMLTSAVGGDKQAELTFMPPAAGDPTSYTATCNPGGLTVTGASSPLTVTGMTNGTTYSCTVHGTNAVGDGLESTPLEVLPGVVPGAPTNVAAVVAGTTSTISFSPPADDGGLAITEYDVSCQAGAIVKSGTASPIALTALAPATYSCTVAAKNAKGVGPASEAVAFTIVAPPVPPGVADGGTHGGTNPDPNPSASGGSSSDGGTNSNTDAGTSGVAPSIDASGCSCHVVNAGAYSPLGGLSVVAGAIAAFIRRRKTRKS